MPELALNDEQAEVVRGANALVAVRDSSGKLIGHVLPEVDAEKLRNSFTEEELREAKRRAKSDGPWHTTQEVLARLADLESNR